GLRSHEGHRHSVADLAAAKLRLEDERELVGRAEARGALRRADYHRTRLLAEGLEPGRGFLRVVDMADRGCEAVGTEALDLVEREFRPGCYDEVVVAQRRAVGGLERIVLRGELRHRARPEGNAALGEGRGEIDLQGFALAPADGDPGVRRNEVIKGVLGNDGELVLRPHLALH